MLWEVSWGAEVKTLLEIQQQTGRTPKALQERPTLRPENLGIYQDFVFLQSGRCAGFSGPNPISVADMVAYLQVFPIGSAERRARWMRLVRRIDSAVLDRIYDKQAQERKE